MTATDRCARDPHILVDARFRTQRLGGDRCRFELASNLGQINRNRYTFLVYEDGRRYFTEEQTLVTHYQPEQHPWSDLFEHIQLPHAARRINTDIYHGTFNVLPLLAPSRMSIVTIHDMAVFAFPEAYGQRFSRYMRWLIKESVKRANLIITVSETTRKELIRFIPNVERKIHPILNGVGEEFVRAASLNQMVVDEIKLKYDIRSPYVLFVGNLERKKNLNRLILAFNRLHKNAEVKHKLVVVGRPLDRGPDAGLSEVNIADDLLHFIGYVDDIDLPALYRGADLVAYPSLYEGFGMPVLEGMATGVPVLTSSVSSLPEVAGGAAMLVDPQDIDGIAAGLYQAITDTNWRRAAIEAGLKRAKSLSWRNNAEETIRIYERLWSFGSNALGPEKSA